MATEQGAAFMKRRAAWSSGRLGSTVAWQSNRMTQIQVNSMPPGRCGSNFKNAIFQQSLSIKLMTTLCEIALRWMAQNTFDDNSTLVQVMAWCCHAPSHYLNHCWPRSMSSMVSLLLFWRPGGRFKNTYELLNPRALKISMLYKNRIFQCMGKIFCVEFQRYPLKFHSKYLTHTLKDVHFIHRWKFKSS